MNPIDWQSMWTPHLHPAETFLRVTVVYLSVQLGLRLAGRKELGRTSLWDVAALFLIGTALRKTLVRDDPSLTTGLLALTTLLAWDRFLSWLAFHSRLASRIIRGHKVELMSDGQFVEAGLRRTLLSREQVQSQLREKGHEDLSRVRKAYMEADGKVTFLLKDT